MSINENKNQIMEETVNMEPDHIEVMESETETTMWARVKRYGKPLAIAAIGVVGMVGVFYGVKNKKVATKFLVAYQETAKRVVNDVNEAVTEVLVDGPTAIEPVSLARTYTKPTVPVAVVGHVREMSEGKCHSLAQVAKAAEAGIYNLKANETYVSPHTRYAA